MVSRRRIIGFAIGKMLRQDGWAEKYDPKNQFHVNQYDYSTCKEYVNALKEKWQEYEDPECEFEDYVNVSNYSNYDDYAYDIDVYRTRLEWRDEMDCDCEFDVNPCDFEYKEYYVKALKRAMKDYMASGSFARGKEEKAASASMVFVGNINQSVDVLLKTSSLFDPFPPEMATDTAFLDRIHCYLPGWEVPKFRPEHFTDDYGFITDYFAEFIRELRKSQESDALDKYFKLGKNLNQRDTIAVRKTVSGLVKLLYPDGEYSKDELEEILRLALEMRRRVKEQLKKIGGMEFYDVNFSYIDNETFEEKYVSVPEQGSSTLIPEGMCNPGQVYTVSTGKSGMIGLFRLESQLLPGNGKFTCNGLGSDREARESTQNAFNYLRQMEIVLVNLLVQQQKTILFNIKTYKVLE